MNKSFGLRRVLVLTYCLIVSCLILTSLYFVRANYFVTPHWDQWEFYRLMSADQNQLWTLGYIFSPHNEHVMFSSRLLLLLDVAVFKATNIFPICVTIVANLLIAGVLACDTFPNSSEKKLLAFSAFAASGLSLAQWENLLWAFQTSFALVCLGSVLTISSIVQWIRTEDHQHKLLWFIAICGCLFFSIMSLANGFTLIVSIAVILIALRRPFQDWLLVLIPYVVIAACFFYLTRAGHVVGDQSLRTVQNYLLFFVTVVGSPLSSRVVVAAIIGTTYVVLFGTLFVWTIALPWWRRSAIDYHLLKLMAFGGFLLATAAAISWGRVPLGLPSAVASRYSTSILLLWMVGFASLARHASFAWSSGPVARFLPNTAILLALVVAAASSLRPSNFIGIDYYSTRIRQAAYFIVSGVLSDEQLSSLYPDPAVIRGPLEFLREHRLNIFSEQSGLRKPSIDLLISGTSMTYPPCTLFNVDSVRGLNERGWEIIGWVAHPVTKASPDWVIAIDRQQRLRGFTQPLAHRPDVIAAIKAAGSYRGFTVPVGPVSSLNTIDGKDDMISLFVVFPHGVGSCRIELGKVDR